MLFNCKDLQKIWNNQINSVTLHPEIVCLYFPEKGCHLGTNRSDNET